MLRYIYNQGIHKLWIARFCVSLKETFSQSATPARALASFGSIGSGKTSGSGQALALAYLRAGFGGLVLCAKCMDGIHG